MGAETAGRPGDEGGLSCQIQQIAHIDSIGSSLQIMDQDCGTIKRSGIGRGRCNAGVRDERRAGGVGSPRVRSEEDTSEVQSLMRKSSAVFCLKKKEQRIQTSA